MDKTTFFMQWLMSFWNLLPQEAAKAVGNSPIREEPQTNEQTRDL